MSTDTMPRTPEEVRLGEAVKTRWVGVALILLGAAVAACAALGPLMLDVIEYRVSPSAVRQIVGVDAIGLVVVAPWSVAVGVAVLRGRRGVVPLGVAPALFAAYTYAQLFVGNEYLYLPGNVERFSPLLLTTFVLAVAVIAGVTNVWTTLPALPSSSRVNRLAGATLLLIAAFVVVGIHLRSYVDALSTRPTGAGYLADPTAFWLVKFMDLGLVTPAAVTLGIGMLRGRCWARRPAYAIVGGYALLGLSVAAMAVLMYLSGDPDGSLGMTLGSITAAALLVGVAGYLYRPLLTARSH